MVFPSSSSPKGHPAGPSRRATGGGRPPGGARAGPGAHCGVGPAWVARGLFPAEQPSNPATGAKSEDAQITSVFSSNHRLACAASRLSALEPSRRRPLEGPPRGQGRRVTGRPSPPRSKSRAALPDQQPASLTFPSPTSSSSGSMYDPNDVPDNISGARDDAPMEMKPLDTNVPHCTAYWTADLTRRGRERVGISERELFQKGTFLTRVLPPGPEGELGTKISKTETPGMRRGGVKGAPNTEGARVQKGSFFKKVAF